MAPREPQKARRAAPKKKTATNQLASAVERLESKISVLQAERDTLKSDLKAAMARIGELEAAQTDAANRIDWVIDSLHNILEDKA